MKEYYKSEEYDVIQAMFKAVIEQCMIHDLPPAAVFVQMITCREMIRRDLLQENRLKQEDIEALEKIAADIIKEYDKYK